MNAGSGRTLEAARTLAAQHVSPEELARAAGRAWELIEEALATGAMSVSETRHIVLDDGEYLGLVKWAAAYRQPSTTRAAVALGLVPRSQ